MAKQFPRALIASASDPSLKKVFVLEYQKARADDCDNCSGMGYLYIFAATEGPYQGPTAPYQNNKSSKWHDGKWWIGTTAAFTCPACKGLGYIDDGRKHAFVFNPATVQLAERLAK